MKKKKTRKIILRSQNLIRRKISQLLFHYCVVINQSHLILIEYLEVITTWWMRDHSPNDYKNIFKKHLNPIIINNHFKMLSVNSMKSYSNNTKGKRYNNGKSITYGSIFVCTCTSNKKICNDKSIDLILGKNHTTCPFLLLFIVIHTISTPWSYSPIVYIWSTLHLLFMTNKYGELSTTIRKKRNRDFRLENSIFYFRVSSLTTTVLYTYTTYTCYIIEAGRISWIIAKCIT